MVLLNAAGESVVADLVLPLTPLPLEDLAAVVAVSCFEEPVIDFLAAFELSVLEIVIKGDRTAEAAVGI